MARKINKQPIERGKRIPAKATELDEDEHLGYPVFSFRHVSNSHCLLSEWQAGEIDELINTLKTVEQVPWNNIWRHKGLKFTKIPLNQIKVPIPKEVSEDETIYEFRVCVVKRVFGYRTDHNVFRIIWFDREHKVVPYHKQRA